MNTMKKAGFVASITKRLTVVCLISALSQAAVNIMGLELPNVELIEDKRGAGMPFMHESPKALLGKNITSFVIMKPIVGCADSDAIDASHPCHHKNLKLQSTHQGRVKTDVPIYGVLTQPFYDYPETSNPDNGEFAFISNASEQLKDSFVKMSHVKYLEQGGARIVPISYRLDQNQLNSILSQLNGIYIPGDAAAILQNERYLNAVKQIL
jgi:hypothetical protein